MDNDKTQQLASELAPGTAVLTPLELNDIRFQAGRTLLTPEVLRRARRRRGATPPGVRDV